MPSSRSRVSRKASHFKSLLALSCLSVLVSTAQASRFALGMQFENWTGVDLERAVNPGDANKTDPGYNHLNFDLKGMTNYYLEEPGFIFGLIAGVAQTEANEVGARNEAARKGEHVYTWKYATPPPIPEGRWFRWGYTSGYQKGGRRGYVTQALTDGKDSLVSKYDPTLIINYHRYDMNMMTAPRLIGKTDFYWNIGSELSGTSVKIYDSQTQPGDDFSFMSTPLNLHIGWQPRIFPYLMVAGTGGVDIIDPVIQAIVGLDNYSLPYSYGARASLGVNWFSIYWNFSHQVESLYNGASYSRKYEGNWNNFGARLDIGNLIFGMLN